MAPQTLRRPRVLLSFHFFRKEGPEVIRRLFGDQPVDVFADSGAYSAFSSGASISVEEYGEWLKVWAPVLTCAAALDDITSPQKSWDQTEKLRTLVGDKVEIIPIYHSLDRDWSWLVRMQDAEYEYVGVSPIGWLYGSPKMMKAWFAKCFALRREGVKYHGFGVTSIRSLATFPFWSGDSSTWTMVTRYGRFPMLDRERCAMPQVNLNDPLIRATYASRLRGWGIDPTKDTRNQVRNSLETASARAWFEVEPYLRGIAPQAFGMYQERNPRVYLACGPSNLQHVQAALTPAHGAHTP